MVPIDANEFNAHEAFLQAVAAEDIARLERTYMFEERPAVLKGMIVKWSDENLTRLFPDFAASTIIRLRAVPLTFEQAESRIREANRRQVAARSKENPQEESELPN